MLIQLSNSKFLVSYLFRVVTWLQVIINFVNLLKNWHLKSKNTFCLNLVLDTQKCNNYLQLVTITALYKPV